MSDRVVVIKTQPERVVVQGGLPGPKGDPGTSVIADGSITVAKLAFDPATQAELDAHGHPAPAAMVAHDGTPAVGDWLRVKSVNPLVVEKAAAPSSGLWPPYPINRYTQVVPDTNALLGLTKNREYALPILISKAMTFDRIGVRFWNIGDAGTTVRLAMRADAEGQPGPVVQQGGITPVGGWTFLAISAALSAGVHWVSVVGQGWPTNGPTIRASDRVGMAPLIMGGAHATASWPDGHGPVVAVQDGITGVIPDTFVNVASESINPPVIAIRRSL